MGSEELASVDTEGKLLSNPWPALLGGLAANAGTWFWFQAFGTQALALVLPGLLATAIGTAISGAGVYKRQTASLMKELEI